MVAWGQWGQTATGDAIFAGMSRGVIDHFLLRPGKPPDELFHQAISSVLLEWAEARREAPYSVEVVATSWSGRAYELRSALVRCAIPHSFFLADSPDGQRIVAAAGNGRGLPLVAFPDGTILTDPSNVDLARAAGSPVHLDAIDFDIVVIGAGPAGLSAAVYGASEGFSTLVVDEGGIGGQATSSSLIRNYLGFPRGLSGRRLAQQAYDQAWVFGARFAFMHRVTGIERNNDGLKVELSDGGPVRCHAVVLAMGVEYSRLGVPELEELNGAGVFYGGPASEVGLADDDVHVLGGANSAGQAALHLAQHARSVTLVVRANALSAGMSDYLVRQIEATPSIEVRLGTEIVGGGGDGWLEQLVLRNCEDRSEEKVNSDGLFLMIGAHPRTDWLPAEIKRDEKGFVLTGSDLEIGGSWPLEREPFSSRPACPESWPWETSATALRNASPPRSGTDRSQSRCSTACSTRASICPRAVRRKPAKPDRRVHREAGSAVTRLPRIPPISSIAPALWSGSFRFPHFGLWTQEGHPEAHGHSETNRSAFPTSSGKRSNPRSAIPTPPGCPS